MSFLKERTRARRLANLAEGGRDGLPRKKQTFWTRMQFREIDEGLSYFLALQGIYLITTENEDLAVTEDLSSASFFKFNIF